MVHVMLDASSLLLAKMVGCMQLFQWLHPLIILICAGYRIPRDPFVPPEKRDKVRQKYHRSPFFPPCFDVRCPPGCRGVAGDRTRWQPLQSICVTSKRGHVSCADGDLNQHCGFTG